MAGFSRIFEIPDGRRNVEDLFEAFMVDHLEETVRQPLEGLAQLLWGVARRREQTRVELDGDLLREAALDKVGVFEV